MHDTIQLGPFRLENRIGEGGMGTVYRGEHRRTDVSVAIKVIGRVTDREDRRRFHREVQAHAGLLHPGIVYLFEYGQVEADLQAASEGRLAEGNPYVAMELADRGTVRDWMPLANWRQVAELLVQILDALAHAHARQVIHRDLKPENFLVFERADRPGPRVKLADFGIAHAFGREQSLETRELETAAGTPTYMSPEQLDGEWRRYGPWTDLYAVGCIAWELVCGRPPFSGESVSSMAIRHATAERPPLDPLFPVPDALEGWIHRAMAIDPDRRFQRAADALWALPRNLRRPASDEPEPLEMSQSASPDRMSDAAGTTSDERLPPTVTLANTLELEATARAPETQTDEASRDDQPETDDSTSASLPPSSPPPLPDEWPSAATETLPAPLVGTGLGLFGLREPPFVNRTDACARIWEALQRVVDYGSFEIVSLLGEAGTGKSRLAEWTSTRAHEVGAARVIRLLHTPGGGRNEGLTGALERTLRTAKLDRGEVFAHLTDHLPVLADEQPELRRRDARALTEFLRPTDDDADAVDGPRYRFASGHQRRALVIRLLRRLSRCRPVILWVDDLQWGPEALGLLEDLVGLSTGPPDVLALTTIRSEVLADRPKLAERIDALHQTAPTAPISLSPLSRTHQHELLEGLLPLEEELTERLTRRTEGHPLFAMQLLGHWIDSGAIEVGADGFRIAEDQEVALPADIHDLWTDRVDGLLERVDRESESAVLQALELAAALGREVDGREWRHLLEETHLERPDRLRERLIERGLAESTTDGWAFAHGLLVESLTRRARREGRWERHNVRCARVLGRIYDSRQLGPGERIAEHLVEAEQPERALDTLLDESRLALEYGTVQEARRLVRRRRELLDALEVPDRDTRRLEQQHRLAELELAGGHPHQARDRGLEVWETLTGEALQIPRLRIQCAELLGRCGIKLGRPEQCRRWGCRALAISQETDSDRLQGKAHRVVGWGLCLQTRFDQAAEHARQARTCSQRAGDRFGQVQSLRLRAAVAVERNEPEAGELYEQVYHEASNAGYAFAEAKAANGLGDHARFVGQLAEARRHYKNYLQIVRALSRPTSEAIAELNLAMIDLRDGHLERAREYLESAEQHMDATGTEERWRHIVHLVRLTHAAGRADRSTCRDLWSEVHADWLDDTKLARDHPWLLETVGDYALEADWPQLARESWEFARTLWRRLDNDRRVAQIDDRLTQLDR